MTEPKIAQFSSRDGVEELFVNSDTFTLLPPNLSLEIYVYVGTTFAVMAAYALLLLNSIRYIKVVAIPAIILAFVGALWGKFWVKKGRSQHRNNPTANLGGKALRLLPMILVSYGLQLIQLACTPVADLANGQQSGSFVISHFLLFFSSALGALAVMMAALPIGTSQGVPRAQRALHGIFTVILVIAVHTMAAEWMEEDMLLVCMPGLIAALVWFTVNFDHGGCTLSVNKVTSPRATAIVLGAAATLVAYLAPKFAYENKVLATYLYRRILCSCTLSGVLSYFSVWMIRRWPGRTDSAMVLIQLLEFSANICFGISAMVLIKPISSLQNFAADVMRLRLRQWVLSEPKTILNLEVTIYSILCISIACMSKFHDCVSGRIKLIVLLGCTVVLSSLFTQSLVQKFIKQSRE